MTKHKPPIAGTVLRYDYLWSYEDEQDIIEARKSRPVALVLSNGATQGSCIVLPITHREPEPPSQGIEIPADVRATLGLNADRQWIILTELNHFVWPGPDLCVIPNSRPPTPICGTLPKSLLAVVIAQLKALVRARKVTQIRR